MSTILFLMTVPVLAAILMGIIRSNQGRGWIIKVTVVLLMIGVGVLATTYFTSPSQYYVLHYERINQVMLGVECLIGLYILYQAIKYKKYWVFLLDVLQLAAMIGFECYWAPKTTTVNQYLYVDKLTIIMILLVGIIGGLITLFAHSYMAAYHQHHKEIKDRRGIFFSIILLFLSAMIGLVVSNELLWIYFFWELTTLASFLLIGYTQTQEAIHNSFTALGMNLIGGVAFVGAIIYLDLNYGVTNLKALISLSPLEAGVMIPVAFLAIAGLTKSAQLPFSKWLLGAMVAPTPTSALLHSSTMVKAGVYLLIRISPLLAGTVVGNMVIWIGGFTFLWMSCIAISKSDAKKVLAYSTMANLGLIVICAGIGNNEALWAAMMLMIFHGVAKSLLFLSVGATEHMIGSRNIEDYYGLIVKLPEMALMMAIGIAGMFLAPFGMLIAKWAALKAFIDTDNMIIVVVLAYGSGATLFYWTKWLGKLVSQVPEKEHMHQSVGIGERIALISHSVLAIMLCLLFPFVSKYLVVPFLAEHFVVGDVTMISQGNYFIMTLMFGMILIVPFGMRFFGRSKEKIVPIYMAGINMGDNKHFKAAIGEPKKAYLANWYMEDYFGEKKLLPIGILGGIIILVIALGTVFGGII
ncbi:MAG: NADH-quinone oxidoreductase subunit 5 family protein [Cellulosilyticaceae bacterium]